jgi:hypothetical protein
MAMASRIHQVEQHRSTVRGVETITLVSTHHFPRHSHDQFGIGVIAFGAQRSWSGVGPVSASAGEVITVNPGEIHDGVPLGGDARGWRMIYFDPDLVAREVRDEIVSQVEIVHPVARAPGWPCTSPGCLPALRPRGRIVLQRRRVCFAP